MKTLDEVIAEMEGMGFIGTLADALDYLKNYRIAKDLFDRLQEHHREIADRITKPWKNNPPLTWDELKQMEGKPVWVEYENYASDWEIIENVGNFKWADGLFVETNTSILHKEDQGKTWQAYRKER